MTCEELCCSICERNRFSRWRRACEVLAEIHAVTDGDMPDFAVRATETLYLAIFDRLQGAHPLGMTARIVGVAAQVDMQQYRAAVCDLADLEEDERVSQQLNPSERRCPRGRTVDPANLPPLMIHKDGGRVRCPVPVLARVGPFAIHRAVSADQSSPLPYVVTHAQSGRVANFAETVALAKKKARRFADIPGVSWDFNEVPTPEDNARVVEVIREWNAKRGGRP